MECDASRRRSSLDEQLRRIGERWLRANQASKSACSTLVYSDRQVDRKLDTYGVGYTSQSSGISAAFFFFFFLFQSFPQHSGYLCVEEGRTH